MEDSSTVREKINVAVPVETITGLSPSVRDLRVKQGLERDRVSFKIPTNEDAAVHVQHVHGQHSWQAKILKVIHKKWFQRTMIGLLLLDILILFTELFLLSTVSCAITGIRLVPRNKDMKGLIRIDILLCLYIIVLQFPACTLVVRDAISCCPHEEATEARWLASDSHGDSHSDICEAPLEDTDYMAGCDPHKWHTVHTIEDVLFGFTIAILSFMMLELLALMAAISPCIFFRHFWYVLDFFIVAVSLSLEAFFNTVSDDQLATYFGLLVIFRCWRFVRISHGLVEVTSELTSEKYEKVVKQAIELEDLMAEHERKMAAQGIDDSDETASVIEIREKSKELADQLLLATQHSSNSERQHSGRISEIGKNVLSHVTHRSHHNSEKHSDEQAAENGKPDVENVTSIDSGKSEEA